MNGFVKAGKIKPPLFLLRRKSGVLVEIFSYPKLPLIGRALLYRSGIQE